MRFFAAASALTLALGLAACGGSGGTPQSGAQAAVATSTSASAPVGGAPAPSGATTAAPAATATGTTTTTPSRATATSTGSPAPAPDAPCRAAGLALSYLGGQGATGHGELGFALRNIGASPCTSGGYPGIEFLAAGGAPLPTTPERTTSDFFESLPAAPLTVAPGQTMSFRLGVSHGGGSDAGCATADGVQVIAPNDTAPLTVQIPGGASECGTTTVSPVQPGDAAFQS